MGRGRKLTLIQARVGILDICGELVEDIISSTIGFLIATAELRVPATLKTC